MLLLATICYAVLATAATLVAVVPNLARARVWLGLPLVLVLLAAGIWFLERIGQTPTVAIALAVVALLATGLVKAWQPRWGWLAAHLYASVVLGTTAYLVYAAILTFTTGLGWVGTVASALLLLLEIAALSLAASYLFEILDVLGRAAAPRPAPDRDHLPAVALQVPAYNEPVEIVSDTLRSLAKLDYPRLLVQVVDNNTPDPAVWQPLEQLCRELGDRFEFIHLENWPGFKAGALNEATRRLPADIEIVGIVDADYMVEPNWLKETVGYFADPRVAFVQSPQDYRDWQDNGYLRGLYYSYRYFFDVTMPARQHRNAIIFAGTMGLIRRRALDEIGGWNTEIITEDAEASLRMLQRGHRGQYVHEAYGRGLMPLDFGGLKKQRYRWALGGIQILRRHWGTLIRGDGRLTSGQRVHYFLGSAQWFGEVLMAAFTLLLLATAIATAMHHQLPVRRLTGAALAVPLAFLIAGILRALWAIRATVRCTWGDAFNALRVWFALSWVVTLACLGGLVTKRPAFLRTPKRQEGGGKLLRALWASRAESLMTAAAVLGAVVMLVRVPSPPVVALAALLLFQAFLYSNAIWASTAAEGIQLTPTRRAYLRSSQSTGEWPQRAGRLLAVPAVAGAIALVVLLLAALTAPTYVPSVNNPALAPLTGGSPTPAPSPSSQGATPPPIQQSPATVSSPPTVSSPATVPSPAPT